MFYQTIQQLNILHCLGHDVIIWNFRMWNRSPTRALDGRISWLNIWTFSAQIKQSQHSTQLEANQEILFTSQFGLIETHRS